MENSSPSPTSPASRTRFPSDAFRFFPTLFTLIAAVVLLFAIFAVGIIVWFAIHGFDVNGMLHASTGFFGIPLQSAAEVAVIIYLAIAVPAIARCRLRDFGFRLPDGIDARTIVAGVIAMYVAINILSSILTAGLHVKGQEEAIAVYFGMHGWQRAAFVIFGVIVGPFFEESFFRLFIFNAMRKWWNFWPAATFSGILFGLAHFQPGSPALLISLIVPLACGGIVLAYVYERTRNAWAPILTHATYNFVTFVMITAWPQLAK